MDEGMIERIPKLFFGTGLSALKDYDSMYEVVNKAIQSGIRGYDTAPRYKTEAVLAKALLQSIEYNNIKRE